MVTSARPFIHERQPQPHVSASTSAGTPLGVALGNDSPTLAFGCYLLLILVEYLAIADDVPVLKALRFTTVLSYGLGVIALTRATRLDTLLRTQTKIILYFIFMTLLSVTWAIITRLAVDSVRPLVDYLTLTLITAYFVDRRSRIVTFAATLAFVGSMLVFRNLNALGDSSRSMHFDASYFMGDGNDFSWGLNMMMPFAAFLVFSRQSILLRLSGLGAVVLCLMGVIGTSSRGASIGLVAAGLFAWLFVSHRKVIGALLLGLGVVVVMAVAPSGYFTRMQTVTTYEEDNSAQIRLQAWTAAIAMSMDYPFGVGGGNFGSVYGRFYRPVEGSGRISYGASRWVAAHSIYFKVLGEYGVPGLIMLLWLIGANLAANFRSARKLRAGGAAAPIDPLWPGFLNMSLIGTAVSGAFLGGFDYPHLFVLSGLTMAASGITERWAALPAPASIPAASASQPLFPVPPEQRALIPRPGPLVVRHQSTRRAPEARRSPYFD